MFSFSQISWFDWFAAVLLGLCVVFQGIFHFRLEQKHKNEAHNEPAPDTSNLGTQLKYSFIILLVGSILGSTFGGYTGQAYSLATVATAAKTFGRYYLIYCKINSFLLFVLIN